MNIINQDEDSVPLSKRIMELPTIVQFLLVVIVWDIVRELVIGRLVSKWTINQLKEILNGESK